MRRLWLLDLATSKWEKLRRHSRKPCFVDIGGGRIWGQNRLWSKEEFCKAWLSPVSTFLHRASGGVGIQVESAAFFARRCHAFGASGDFGASGGLGPEDTALVEDEFLGSMVTWIASLCPARR